MKQNLVESMGLKGNIHGELTFFIWAGIVHTECKLLLSSVFVTSLNEEVNKTWKPLTQWVIYSVIY